TVSTASRISSMFPALVVSMIFLGRPGVYISVRRACFASRRPTKYPARQMAQEFGQCVEALAEIAFDYPGVQEGVACKGTAAESRTAQVKKKNFLFLNTKEIRFKLADSLAEAEKLGIGVGAGGWCVIKNGIHPIPDLEVLRRWVHESYRLVGL